MCVQLLEDAWLGCWMNRCCRSPRGLVVCTSAAADSSSNILKRARVNTGEQQALRMSEAGAQQVPYELSGIIVHSHDPESVYFLSSMMSFTLVLMKF